MVEDNVNPSETNSFHVTEQRTNSVDLNKKRKLQAELLELPIAKHKCWNGSSPLRSLSTLDENPEAQADGGYEHESRKESNSFVEDSDSAMSGHGESKFQFPQHRPSSSSSCNWSFGSTSNYSSYSSNSTAMTEGTVDKEQFAENFHDPLMGYGSHVHDLCPGCGIDTEKQYPEKEEIEGILDSEEANPNVYVLSSGRLGIINQEPRERKPTIDQEFEQYFSALLL